MCVLNLQWDFTNRMNPGGSVSIFLTRKPNIFKSHLNTVFISVIIDNTYNFFTADLSNIWSETHFLWPATTNINRQLIVKIKKIIQFLFCNRTLLEYTLF